MKKTTNKYIILVRHGAVENPSGRVYNRDSVMNKPLHLSVLGRQQISATIKAILQRGFKIASIYTSPETRTMESSKIIEQISGVKSKKSEELDEVYAPGAYMEGLSMTQWAELKKKSKGDAYDIEIWGKYNHEKPSSVIARMTRFYYHIAKSVRDGETAIFISHGDPIAFLINYLINKKIPDHKILRQLIYPTKGQAIVTIINPDNKFFNYDLITGPELIKGSLY